MRPRLRKLALTLHVTCSVGWLGSVAVVLALAATGMTSDDTQTVRAAYLAMDMTALFVLVPLAVASLLTGIVQSLGTKWGLFRHYWVLIKLVITLLATIILALYTQTLGALADIAAELPPSGGDLAALRTASPVLHAGAGLLLLLTATVLAVYKPRGLTGYGRRKQETQRATSHP